MMDGFTNRLLRNKFPSWTKIYQDESSIGANIFSSICNQIEAVKESFLTNLKCYSDPLKASSLVPALIYSYDLKDFIYYNEILSNRNLFDSARFYKIENNVETEIDVFDSNYFGKERFLSTYSEEFTNQAINDYETTNVLITLNKQTSLENYDADLNYSIPFEDRIIFKKPKHLYLKVSETNYFYSNRDRLGNLILNRSWNVIIRGYNELNNPVEESIEITENQIYKTNTKFKSICDLNRYNKTFIAGGPCITRHGFNGKLEVLNYPINYDVVRIDSKQLAKDKTIKLDDVYESNRSSMYISNDFINNKSQISYLLKLIDDPTIGYNKFDGNFFYTILSQALIDLDNDEYIQDIEYNSVTSKLIAISNKGKLRFYNLGSSPMKIPKLFLNSTEYDIGFESVYQRYSIDETASVIIKHSNISSLINRVVLIVEKPNQSIQYISVNEAGLPVLSNNAYVFSVESHREVEKIWSQLTLEMSLDQIGQYNFYSISLNPVDIKKELANLFDQLNRGEINFLFFKNTVQSYLRSNSNPKGLKINSYSILVESNTSVYEYDLNTSYNLNTTFGIFIDGIENDIYVVKSNLNSIVAMFKLNQKRSGILLDVFSGEFYSHEIINKYRFEFKLINGDTYIYNRG